MTVLASLQWHQVSGKCTATESPFGDSFDSSDASEKEDSKTAFWSRLPKSSTLFQICSSSICQPDLLAGLSIVISTRIRTLVICTDMDKRYLLGSK